MEVVLAVELEGGQGAGPGGVVWTLLPKVAAELKQDRTGVAGVAGSSVRRRSLGLPRLARSG